MTEEMAVTLIPEQKGDVVFNAHTKKKSTKSPQVRLQVAFTPLRSDVLTDSEVNARNGLKGIAKSFA